MNFSRSREWDFPPEPKFHDGTQLQTKTETKLVGVMITQNLNWQINTAYICRHGKSSNPSADTFYPQLKFPQNNIYEFPQNSKNCNRNHIL